MKIVGWYLLCTAAFSSAITHISSNGACGRKNGFTCMNSIFGNCCSNGGTCGATAEHCDDGCQIEYGLCTNVKGSPSQDGTCGGSLGYTCQGSIFGDCCSQYGFCGSTGAYCQEGCQASHGSCNSEWYNNLKRRQPYGTRPAAKSNPVTTVWTSTTMTATETVTAFTPTFPVITLPQNTTQPSNTSADTEAGPACPGILSTGPLDGSCVRCEDQPGTDQWCGYNITTNYYEYTPKTCRTVEYTLVVTNTTFAPDGVPRIGLLVNGTMPGPLIEANWGDTVRVKVINQMQDNGTTIHFHGIRQNHTNQYDGVPSLTQCPIPPGEQMTYVFTATSYGSSWYHSHFALQTWEGVYGPLVIHGPSSAEYDVDAGHVFLQDWSHETVDTLYARSQIPATDDGARAPAMDNGLINGMNTWGPDGSFNQTGKRFEMNVVTGKSYLLRLVSVGIQSGFKFYIDQHKLKVIAIDFTPIVPYETNILDINIGQRYEVIVYADQGVGDYWMRSDNQDPCGSVHQGLDIKGIVHYNGGPQAIPTSTAYNYTPACVDEDPARHTPVMTLDAADADVAYNADITVATNSNNIFKWFIDGTTFVAHWGDPTVRGIVEKGVVNNYSGKLLLTAPMRNAWVYVIMQSTVDFPHPVHLHGHDMLIVGLGNGTYLGDEGLRLRNPARRDTVMMPGGGYVVLAWKTDNPGVWNMHCHVGFHQAMGFAAQIVELEGEIAGTFDDAGSRLGELCGAWNAWADGRGLEPQSGV